MCFFPSLLLDIEQCIICVRRDLSFRDIYSSAPFGSNRRLEADLGRLFVEAFICGGGDPTSGPPAACKVASFPDNHHILTFGLRGGKDNKDVQTEIYTS